MENKKMLSMFALGIVALLGVGFVAAYQGDYSAKGPNYSEDRHLEMQGADYDAWVTLMTEGGRHPRVLDVVTEENFGKFVEAREVGRAGDVDRAAELRAELGLSNGDGPRDGTCLGEGKGLRHRRNFE